MKRTYEQSLTFFKRETNKRGLGRELYKTPINIIHKIVESIITERPELKNRVWIDPCAGDGRWGDVIKDYGIICKSFDIEPLNDKVEKQNFYDYGGDNDIFIIGNPPFSELSKFIDKALSITDCCYFLGGSQIITGKLSSQVSLLHRFEGFEGNQKDKRSKIIFEDTNGKSIPIWCCGALFDTYLHQSYTRYNELKENCFATSVKCYCQDDGNTIVIHK